MFAADKDICDICDIHTVDYCSAIKKNKLLVHSTTDKSFFFKHGQILNCYTKRS